MGLVRAMPTDVQAYMMYMMAPAGVSSVSQEASFRAAICLDAHQLHGYTVPGRGLQRATNHCKIWGNKHQGWKEAIWPHSSRILSAIDLASM